MNKSGTPRLWPMKWVVLAIILFIVIYTVVMIFFRKPGKPYQPYKDASDRATVSRLLSSGYQRIVLDVDRPADPSRLNLLRGAAQAAAHGVSGGFEGDLQAAMIEKPLLADSFDGLRAAADADVDQGYQILFTATIPDNKRVISNAVLYRRGQELSIVPIFERLDPSLQARWRETTILISLPAHSVPAGEYTATLVGARKSLSWSLRIRQ
jgi:hypothetical protein